MLLSFVYFKVNRLFFLTFFFYCFYILAELEQSCVVLVFWFGVFCFFYMWVDKVHFSFCDHSLFLDRFKPKPISIYGQCLSQQVQNP